ncbi:MAG: thiamine pyrophosphate-dependent enzyme [Actinomycetota bacterium]
MIGRHERAQRVSVVISPHDQLDARVRAALADQDEAPNADPERSLLFDAMAGSRQLDIHARRMREHGRGYYTIGSAGHESNALVALGLRDTDPALLHYRSGAFYLARSLQAGRSLDDGLRDVLLGMLGAVADPASGGRHKVFGHPDLAVIPQTSTIASQLPRAVGVAFAIDRARRLGLPTAWPRDALAVTSFGDASVNHSTAAGALNTAGYCVAQGIGLPLLFVCEDNGLGISVPTPQEWVAQAAHRPGIRYVPADGADVDATREVSAEVAQWVRATRRPALLHLRAVRFLGHAGTDVETAYRLAASITADLERDPLLAIGRLLGRGAAARYDEIGRRVVSIADELATAPTLTSSVHVLAPLAPRRAEVIATGARRVADDGAREVVFGGRLPERGSPLTLAQSINAALTDALAARPQVFVFGEDVGRKGGVYGVTRGLQQQFRAGRVFDTLLDEQAILGLGLGFAVSGLLPIPEIQYLAYLHNAEDQLRGEAASLRFFANGAFRNPMVVRVAGLGYQKGFGGHFHNDNAVAVLRDIPGLVLAVPSRPEDAAPMLRSCLAAAEADGQVSVYLEPIALYHERDLYEPGDRGWLGRYPTSDVHVPIGSARVYESSATGADDLTIITFGNGLRMSMRAGARLRTLGIGARIVDLRWIAPLPVADILRAANETGRVLVADETRASGGVSEGVITALVDHGFTGPIMRVASADSFIPLGDAARVVMLSEDDIEQAARKLVAR